MKVVSIKIKTKAKKDKAPNYIIDTGDPNQSFWTLYNVKTKNGIWKKENYPYLEDEGGSKESTDL